MDRSRMNSMKVACITSLLGLFLALAACRSGASESVAQVTCAPTTVEVYRDPDITEIIVGAGATIGAKIEGGVSPSFRWEANRGQLTSSGGEPATTIDNGPASVIYTAPGTPGRDVVTVYVTIAGCVTTEAVSFEVVEKPTETPTPTDTPLPTDTPSPTPTDTPTPVPTPTPTRTPGPHPTPSMVLKVADFECLCNRNLLDGLMGAAYDPPNSLRETYVVDDDSDRSGVAKLEFSLDEDGWSAFWLKLRGADVTDYVRVTFVARGDTAAPIPERFKVELKRNENTEVGICYLSGVTTVWQQFSCTLAELSSVGFADALSALDNTSELVIVFEERFSGSTGVLYVDDIQFEK